MKCYNGSDFHMYEELSNLEGLYDITTRVRDRAGQTYLYKMQQIKVGLMADLLSGKKKISILQRHCMQRLCNQYKRRIMTDKFQNKYRVPSARLQSWDYGWQGAYFITLCTQNREHYFGEIENGTMQLSKIGVIANVLWYEIKNHAKNIELDEFIVMPNHIHGILILNEKNPDGDTTIDNDGDVGDVGDVETRHALSLQSPSQQSPSQQSPSQQSPSLQSPSQQSPSKPLDPSKPPETIGQKRFQNQGKNTISSIIGGYKSVVTKHAHRLGYDFQWQSRFYDHIIRNEKSYHTIRNYIVTNPQNWEAAKLKD